MVIHPHFFRQLKLPDIEKHEIRIPAKFHITAMTCGQNKA